MLFKFYNGIHNYFKGHCSHDGNAWKWALKEYVNKQNKKLNENKKNERID